MKNNWMLVGLLVCAMALSGCAWGFSGIQGSGNVLAETRTVGAFDAVNFATIGTLHVTVGETESLRIEAEDNLLPYFIAEVVHDTLILKSQSGVMFQTTRPVNFYLTIRDLDTLTLDGSGNVILPDLETTTLVLTLNGSGDLDTDQLTATTLETHINGSGNINIAGAVVADQQRIVIKGSGDLRMEELTAESVVAMISGSGNISIAAGAVQLQQLSLNGSGDYQAGTLQSAQTQVGVRGSGSVYVAVTEHLSANLTGSGNVHCTGQPTVEQIVRGSGRLVTLEN